MRKLKSVLLYTALALVANTAQAETADISALRDGDMSKLMIHSEPMAASDQPFMSPDGTEITLADYRGKVILVNFWATWCAPCRKEMPSLAALQDALQGDDFEVVTVAVGRNPKPAMDRFFEEISVDSLPLNTDASQAFARSMMVMGLPISVLIDRDGQEIARLQGDADWSSDSAKAIIAAMIAD